MASHKVRFRHNKTSTLSSVFFFLSHVQHFNLENISPVFFYIHDSFMPYVKLADGYAKVFPSKLISTDTHSLFFA